MIQLKFLRKDLKKFLYEGILKSSFHEMIQLKFLRSDPKKFPRSDPTKFLYEEFLKSYYEMIVKMKIPRYGIYAVVFFVDNEQKQGSSHGSKRRFYI